MLRKADILFHIDTPRAEQLEPLLSECSILQDCSVRQFGDFSELNEHAGLVIAAFQHFDFISPQHLPRVLLVGELSDAPKLKDGRWFKKGLCDALLLPVNAILFSEKVSQLVDRTRELFIEEIVRKIHELYDGGFSPKELSVLNALLRSRERGVTRKEFGDGVWPGLSVHSKTLDTHLFNLRSKLESSGLSIVWQRQAQSWILRSTNPKLRLD